VPPLRPLFSSEQVNGPPPLILWFYVDVSQTVRLEASFPFVGNAFVSGFETGQDDVIPS